MVKAVRYLLELCYSIPMDTWLGILMVLISSRLSEFSAYIFLIISCNFVLSGNEDVALLLAAMYFKKTNH